MTSDAFARAYVATLFLLGERGDDLALGAGEYARSPLVRALTSEEKPKRVAALAHEVARIALALEKGGIS